MRLASVTRYGCQEATRLVQALVPEGEQSKQLVDTAPIKESVTIAIKTAEEHHTSACCMPAEHGALLQPRPGRRPSGLFEAPVASKLALHCKVSRARINAGSLLMLCRNGSLLARSLVVPGRGF